MNADFKPEPARADAAAILAPPGQTQQIDVLPEQLEEQRIVGLRHSDTRARPFKLLRTQILKRSQEEGLKLIGVTSAAPNVGKTFVAANLAAAMSRIADLDVYLIDLDLHRPAVARRFSIREGRGIHDFLNEDVPDVQSIAYRINDERLVVVPGFAREVGTGELLTNTRGEQLFAGLRALPDNAIVIVDMPPIFADDDAVIIGQHLDGFILVAEDGRTTAKQVRETVRMLQPAPFLGSVLNRFRNQLFADDYGYGFSYGYGGYY